jgi:hypothetical protein
MPEVSQTTCKWSPGNSNEIGLQDIVVGKEEIS